MKCFICRREISWMWRGAFGTFKDYETGEKYCLCTKCPGSIIRRGYIVYHEAKIKGIKQCVRELQQLKLLKNEQIAAILKDEIDKLIKKSLKVATRWITYDIDKFIVIDDTTYRILLNKSIYNFSDIIDYSILDNSITHHIQAPTTTLYNTKSHNGLARTIAGGIIAGPAGAIMGGITSKHTLSIENSTIDKYSATIHDYTIHIKTSTISKPLEILKIGEDSDCMYTITSLLEQIKEFNNRNQ